MISLFDADCDSSDSEDFDYAPSKTDADLSEASDNELVSSGESDDATTTHIQKKETENIKSVKKRNVRNRGNSLKKKEVSCEESKNSSTCVTSDAEKEKPNDIWQRFLEEVNGETKKTEEREISDETVEKVCDSSSRSDVSELCRKEDSGTEKVEIDPEEKNLGATTIFEFAGEAVAVKDNKILNAEDTSSNSNASGVQTSSAPSDSSKQGVKRKLGLDSVLATVMNKKHKLTTLEKSLYDWQSYKSDEGIHDELNRFNKGKGGYLERQRFLERSDLRTFEIEKATREKHSKRKKL